MPTRGIVPRTQLHCVVSNVPGSKLASYAYLRMACGCGLRRTWCLMASSHVMTFTCEHALSFVRYCWYCGRLFGRGAEDSLTNSSKQPAFSQAAPTSARNITTCNPLPQRRQSPHPSDIAPASSISIDSTITPPITRRPRLPHDRNIRRPRLDAGSRYMHPSLGRGTAEHLLQRRA